MPRPAAKRLSFLLLEGLVDGIGQQRRSSRVEPSGRSTRRALRLICVWVVLGLVPCARAAVHPLLPAAAQAFTDVVSAPPTRAPKVDSTGRWVVYLADVDTDGVEELWTAPLLGGEPFRISTAMSAGDEIQEFQVSPDGSSVAFMAHNFQEPMRLYQVSILGGQVFLKSYNLTTQSVVSFGFSPDSTWLVFTATPDGYVRSIYRADSGGVFAPAGYSYTSQAFGCDAKVDRFVISPDSENVAFRVAYDCGGGFGYQSLHRALISDTTSWTVATGVATSEVVDFKYLNQPNVSPAVLVYLIDPDGYGGAQSATLGWDDYTSWDSNHYIGTAAATNGTITSFEVVPNSNSVIYRSDYELNEQFELFRTTAGVHGTVQTHVQVYDWESLQVVLENYRITPDGSRVVFIWTNGVTFVDQTLRSREIASPGPSTLLESVSSPGIFERLEIAPDGRVVFRADRDEPDRVELFSVPAAGGTVVRLNPTFNFLLTSWDVHDFSLASDGSHVAYVFETETVLSGARSMQLRSSPTAGGGSVVVGPTLDPTTHDAFLALAAPATSGFALRQHWTVSVNDHLSATQRGIWLSDHCLYCDGVEGTGDGLARWSDSVP